MRIDRSALLLCAVLLPAWLLVGTNAKAQNSLVLRPPAPAEESSQPSQFRIEAWPAPPDSSVKVLEAPRTAAQPASVRTPATSPLPTPYSDAAPTRVAAPASSRPQEAPPAPGLRWQGSAADTTSPYPTPAQRPSVSAFPAQQMMPTIAPPSRQPISIAQAVIPELELPTEVGAEPPVLYMPHNGTGIQAGNMGGQSGMDEAYESGVRYLRCGMPLAALDVMQCSSSATNDIKYSKELAIGAAFGQLNLLEEARCHYCRVLHESDNPVLRKIAQDYLNQVDQSLETREFLRGGGSAAVRYDTDPGILPTFNAVGIPRHSPASMGDQYSANLGYDIGRSYNSDLTLGYTLYGTNNYQQLANDFDVNQNEVFMLYRRRSYWRDTPTYFGGQIGYQYMTVGGQSFLSRPLFSAYTTFLQDDRRSTLIYGDFGVYDYLGTFNPGGPALDTDSRQGRVGITFRKKVGACRNMMIAGGYQFQVNDSDGTDYDFTGHSAIGYMLWNLPVADAQFMLTGQYIYRNYSNVNSIVGYRRQDNEMAFYGTLLVPITKQWFFIWEAGVDNNISNVSFNKYDRVWTSLGIEFRFPQSWAMRSRMIN